MTAKSEKKKDKIKMKRLISNVLYVIKYAFRHDSRLPLSYIISRCVFMEIGAFIDTFLLMEIINIFTTTADILSVVKVLAFMLISCNLFDFVAIISIFLSLSKIFSIFSTIASLARVNSFINSPVFVLVG